jgi:hypothetical protein
MAQIPNLMVSDGSNFIRMRVRPLGNISWSEPSGNASLRTSRANPRQPVNADLGVERAENFGHQSIAHLPGSPERRGLSVSCLCNDQRVSTDRKPRRSVGTRTMFDVLKSFFRRPTLELKAADLKEVMEGRELLVSCRLPLTPGKGIRWIPQGYLHVYSDRVVWKGRGHSEATFCRGDWLVRMTPPTPVRSQWGIISLLNKSDSRIHQEMRVPTPDMDLIRAVLSDESTVP